MLEKYKYCELIKGGANNRGNVIDINGKKNWELDYYGKPGIVDAYHSAYMHSIDYLNYRDVEGGKTGFQGSVGADCLFWDFDSSVIEEAYEDTCELIRRLIKSYQGEGRIRVYYSGNKGFHVIFVASRELATFNQMANIHTLVGNTCDKIATGLNTFDSVIYDRSRIFRTPNSINSKTGLYKIPVPSRWFDGKYSKQELEQSALSQSYLIYDGIPDVLCPELVALMFNSISGEEEQKERRKISKTSFMSGLKNGFTDGERNVGLCSLAGLLHSRNLQDDFVTLMLEAVNDKSENPLPSNEVDSIVKSIGRYPVNNEFINPSENDIMTFKDAAKKWKEVRERTIQGTTGFPHLDIIVPLFDPSQVFAIAARAKVGKSQTGMLIGKNIADSLKGKSLFVSMEMQAPTIFARAATAEYHRDSEDVLDMGKMNEMLLKNEDYIKHIYEQWESMYIIDKPALSMGDIEAYYQICQEKSNYAMTNVIVDYIGLVKGGGNYEGISQIARDLKTVAKRLNTRVIVLFQLSRAGGDGTIPVQMDFIRDSGQLEEACDYILGMWRSKTDEKRMHCGIIANRHGDRGQFDIINKGFYLTSTEYIEDDAVNSF